MVGLGVVSDDGGVDEKGQKSVLIGRVIIFQQSGCVVVAAQRISVHFQEQKGYVLPDRRVRWTLGNARTDDSSNNNEALKKHDGRWSSRWEANSKKKCGELLYERRSTDR